MKLTDGRIRRLQWSIDQVRRWLGVLRHRQTELHSQIEYASAKLALLEAQLSGQMEWQPKRRKPRKRRAA
jgi:hypothetical protein